MEFMGTLVERLMANNSGKSGLQNQSTCQEKDIIETLDIPDVHGWMGRSRGWDNPVKVTHCESEARPGKDGFCICRKRVDNTTQGIPLFRRTSTTMYQKFCVKR
jgi:hypothetical protein